MTTTTASLTDFLLARIAEDEAIANATAADVDAADWSEDDCGMVGPVDGHAGYASIMVDPARVLAECAAKRAIVALHEPQKGEHWGQSDETCTVCSEFHSDIACVDESWPCETLRILASVYSDHPEYRDEWRL